MRGIKVLFLQLEVIPNCPPHMGMCLFFEDLREKGIICEGYIVNSGYVGEIIPIIEEGNYDLICLESIFTIDTINPILERFPHAPVLVGGINAISLLVHTDIKYAVFGPGRKAISAFIDQYFSGGNLAEVPNLFFKDGDGIFYSGKTQHWNLSEELFPYRPFLDWRYAGPQRDERASFNDVSIIAGTGCYYSNAAPSTHDFPIEATMRGLGYHISGGALKRMEEIYNRKNHGCSFCVFQYQEHTGLAVAETVNLLLRQARHLYATHGITSFQVQTETPLLFLDRLIESLIGSGIPLSKISIRTRANLLLTHRNCLLKCLAMARQKNFCLSIEQIGFESFYDDDLLKFDKRVDIGTNLEVLQFLRGIRREFGEHACVDIGHGIILFHPWTTIESITENLKVISRYRDIFPNLFLGSLILYSEFLPIYPRIMEQNLVKKSSYWYGLEYVMNDPAANKAYELYRILLSYFGGDIPIEGYMKSMEFMRSHSLDEILKGVFSLVLVDED